MGELAAPSATQKDEDAGGIRDTGLLRFIRRSPTLNNTSIYALVRLGNSSYSLGAWLGFSRRGQFDSRSARCCPRRPGFAMITGRRV